MVLAKNDKGVLPLQKGQYKQIAVVGPFAACLSFEQDRCYLHSYNGQPSYQVTILDAIREQAQATGAAVVFEEGTSDVANSTLSSIAKAVAAAKASDLTIVVLGLGSAIEAEGRDRYSLGFPPVQADLLAAVRAASPNKLVLVSVSAGPVSFDTSLADAILFAGYGGQVRAWKKKKMMMMMMMMMMMKVELKGNRKKKEEEEKKNKE